MRKTLTTAALLLALSCPAFAGEIQTPGAPAPPPPSPVQEPTLNGQMPNGAADILTQTALDLLAFLPSIL